MVIVILNVDGRTSGYRSLPVSAYIDLSFRVLFRKRQRLPGVKESIAMLSVAGIARTVMAADINATAQHNGRKRVNFQLRKLLGILFRI
jgi:hypothetical protein